MHPFIKKFTNHLIRELHHVLEVEWCFDSQLKTNHGNFSNDTYAVAIQIDLVSSFFILNDAAFEG